ncbi:MAG TPA: hemolysin family protein [Acidimicrobiales bacterium]|nr:hemolysin family protein [Acidimicrobiales bacterium]
MGGPVIAAAGFRTSDVALLVVIFVLLCGSGFLALAETSLLRTSKVRAHTLREDGKSGSRRLERLVDNPQAFLNPVLLMVLVCQLVAATLVGVLASRWFGPLGIVIATVAQVVVVFVVFEAVPKNWAVRHTDRAALFAAPVIYAVTRFPPVRWVSSMLIGLADLLMGGRHTELPSVTESELLAMADVAHADDVIEPTEREFIHSVIEFGDTVVREVMVPRPDMVTVAHDASVSSALERGLQAGFSRLPVLGEDIDDVVGIAFTKDLVQVERSGGGSRDVSTAVRPAKFVPETKRVATLLTEMQSENVHLAIVVDEYGGTAGLATLEDVLEELVGDIRDEFDIEEPEVSHRADGIVVVSGRMSIDEVDELLDEPLPKGSWDTVGGLAYDLAGGVPAEGQVLASPPFRFTVERVEGRRILRVRIERVAPSQPVAS